MMEERTVNIMLNATAELNRKERDDLYIPVRSSEYRELVRDNADLAAALKIAENERMSASAERYHLRDVVKSLEEKIAVLESRIKECEE